MLTTKEKEVYDFVENYITLHAISPTLLEIAEGIGIQSKGTASRYVNRLIDYGLLSKVKQKGSSRNLVIINNIYPAKSNLSNNSIPLYGTIAAGLPIEAIANNEAICLGDVISGQNLFMLRVKGDSMIEDGIFDGDYIICEQTATAEEGEIVVALINQGEATLKRIYHRGEKVILCPANCNMTPMEFLAEEVMIQGRLKHTVRSY